MMFLQGSCRLSGGYECLLDRLFKEVRSYGEHSFLLVMLLLTYTTQNAKLCESAFPLSLFTVNHHTTSAGHILVLPIYERVSLDGSFVRTRNFSEEEPKNLATSVPSLSLLMIHDAVGGGQHNMAELSRWKKVRSDLFKFLDWHIITRGDDRALVQATQKIDHNLAIPLVIDNLKLSNIA
eukprot:Blabericola_migrator_1__2584@NODE_172_length_12094_cov_159_438181_g149_i0_p9_GENE_NODE_172_length_12094_cov_159_438181_g149_i0NODE_172_length_12094_cov_159_438181_g149_i0_p9_ORF_typecomplete_len180_score28_21_NODE_172_length_12094_cov_159_438181_g149_i054525991